MMKSIDYLNKISEISDKIIKMAELGKDTAALEQMLQQIMTAAMQQPEPEKEPEKEQEKEPEKEPEKTGEEPETIELEPSDGDDEEFFL